MMDRKVVVAITCGGIGDWFLFDTFEEADEHPLIQYGDVIMTHDKHFLSQFNCLEYPWLLKQIDMEEIPPKLQFLERNSAKIWARIVSKAQKPPTDPAVICEMVRNDRKSTKLERQKMTATTQKDSKPAEEKKKKTPPKRERKYAGEMKITLLENADGVPYSKTNNPKRPGSKTHAMFEKYENGITVDQAIARGIDYATIVYDADKQFIAIK